MSDPIADYNTAADGFAAALDGSTAADGFAAQTPCSDWKVQDVVDHVFGGTAYFTEVFGGAALAFFGRDAR